MVYYKSRYAKRRGTTRYRKRTYRPRYTRRTPYRRRRFVYNKANKAEWKQTLPVSAVQMLNIAAASYGSSLTVNPSSANSMITGVNPGQRIGRRLNANFMKLRWQADLIDRANLDVDGMSIRFIAIQVKGNAAASPVVAPYRIVDLFPDLSAGSGDPSWKLAPIAPFRDGVTNTCTILFDRTYKLNSNSSTSQVIFKRKLRMRPLKWEIALDPNGNPAYNAQASNPVFFYWIVAASDIAAVATPLPLNIIHRLVYTDS